MDDLRSWLIAALQGLALEFPGPVDLDTPLADEGLCLDSIGVLELIAAIEVHTGVRISEDEITDAHFGTVGRLLQFLSARV